MTQAGSGEITPAAGARLLHKINLCRVIRQLTLRKIL